MALLVLLAAAAPAGFVPARPHLLRHTLILAAEQSSEPFQNTHFALSAFLKIRSSPVVQTILCTSRLGPFFRHSRARGNPGFSRDWIPVFTGMTKYASRDVSSRACWTKRNISLSTGAHCKPMPVKSASNFP
jgi:hypothetical protein